MLFPQLRSSDGHKHQDNTRVSAYEIIHDSTYIILFFYTTQSSGDKKRPD